MNNKIEPEKLANTTIGCTKYRKQNNQTWTNEGTTPPWVLHRRSSTKTTENLKMNSIGAHRNQWISLTVLPPESKSHYQIQTKPPHHEKLERVK
jgi:hypothetical protein